MFEALNTFHDYASATICHWVLMGICGALTVESHYRGGPMLRHLATVMVGFWLAYEWGEFARIADRVDADTANGLLGYAVGALLVSAYHYGKRKWRKHHA